MMKTLTDLTGNVTEAELREPRGMLTNLHLEPAPGIHVQCSLGSAGLFFRRGEARAALPLGAITDLVFKLCPELLVTGGAAKIELRPKMAEAAKQIHARYPAAHLPPTKSSPAAK